MDDDIQQVDLPPVPVLEPLQLLYEGLVVEGQLTQLACHVPNVPLGVHVGDLKKYFEIKLNSFS